MDHYQDIHILPDPEFPVPLLMNALFAKLHRAMVALDNNSVGISFPNADEKRPSLGDVLRLHGSSDALLTLQEPDWQTGMRDHVRINAIGPIPDVVKYCRVERVQVKSSVDRLRRRYGKRHPDVAEEQLQELIPASVEKRVHLPYLQLKSTSTGQRFRLFIKQKENEHAVVGEFNHYGLSQTATVPWF